MKSAGKARGMHRKAFCILIGIVTAALVLLISMSISAANENAWDVCYEMPNQNIEWSGAGYSGNWWR